MEKAAYAGGDDDVNKNKAEDDSAAAIAEWDYFSFSFEASKSENDILSRCYPFLITKKVSANPIQSDYFQNDQIASESQEKPENMQNLDSSKSNSIISIHLKVMWINPYFLT